MKIDLVGVGKLKFPLTLNGVKYDRTNRGKVTSDYTLSFTSAGGVVIDLIVSENPEMVNASSIRINVDGVRVKGKYNDNPGGFLHATEEIPDARLRTIVEKAIHDLGAEERRIDPTGRHTKAKREALAQAELAAKRESTRAENDAKLRKALDRL